jgi:Holliday junction DNA helicase RuvB
VGGIPQHILDDLFSDQDTATPAPKRGEAIFEGTDYPRTWDGFVGQTEAKHQLQVAIASARARGARIDHTLLASGLHGVGKSTLAALIAGHAEVGLVQTTGPLTAGEAKSLMSAMEDRDILFIDEAHLLTSGNRNRADWLLPFMTEGVLYTSRGAEEMPHITVVAATTDVGRLPQTLISRFMVQPTIVPYSDQEGACIAASLAERMQVAGLADEHFRQIARAADCNPRVMRQILTGVRDLSYAAPEGHPDLATAFRWAGVSADGLTVIAREILILLAFAEGRTMSADSIRANLNEPGPIHHHEQQLLQRGLITITGRGRKLTDYGFARAREEAKAIREGS